VVENHWLLTSIYKKGPEKGDYGYNVI